MNLMEQFTDPELIGSMSVMEKLAGAGITAVMGMGVTFFVLFFLWACIALMTQFAGRSNAVCRRETAAAVSQLKETADVHTAIIAAAVAAYEHGNARLLIRKVRRCAGKSVWVTSALERKDFR